MTPELTSPTPQNSLSGNRPVPPWLVLPERGFLDERQERQLDAIFARVLPADRSRGIPGAVEAGASRFVSLLLTRDASTYVLIPDWQRLYPVALEALEAYSRQNYGKGLVEIDERQMNAIIAGLERGSLDGLPVSIDQKLLFKTFQRHCIQGCFADPRWGGNRDKIMWRWIGYLQQPEEF